MNTRHTQILDTSYPTNTGFPTVDISQFMQGEIMTQNMENGINRKNHMVSIEKKIQKLFNLLPNYPTLLTGPIRHLKVEPHYREPTSRLWLTPQTYRKTSKIRLTGNWIEKAGFITHERIRVIPMHRMLIIVPEE